MAACYACSNMHCFRHGSLMLLDCRSKQEVGQVICAASNNGPREWGSRQAGDLEMTTPIAGIASASATCDVTGCKYAHMR